MPGLVYLWGVHEGEGVRFNMGRWMGMILGMGLWPLDGEVPVLTGGCGRRI